MKTLPRVVKQWTNNQSPLQVFRLIEIEPQQNYHSRFMLEQRYEDLMGGPMWRQINKDNHQENIINALLDN